ncbi:MAG: hypothetical protein J0H64_08405 [Actinobacteria bacterium]|nr:hypothetical protein [Actinomycetota bacterium]
MVRSNNQDSGYAGYRLFLVADGMGGHAGGDVASALTTQAMARIDAPLPVRRESADAPLAEHRDGAEATQAAGPTGDASDRALAEPEDPATGPNTVPLVTGQIPTRRDNTDRTGGPDTGQSRAAASAAPANPQLDDPTTATMLLRDQLLQTNRMLRATVGDRPELSGMGTTSAVPLTSELEQYR